MEQAWGRLHMTFHVPIIATGQVKFAKKCRNRKAWQGRDSQDGDSSDSEDEDDEDQDEEEDSE